MRAVGNVNDSVYWFRSITFIICFMFKDDVAFSLQTATTEHLDALRIKYGIYSP